MIKWLSDILGDSYTEDIDREVSKKIGEGFVSKEDFNELNAKRKALEVQVKDLSAADEDRQSLKTRLAELQQSIDQREEETRLAAEAKALEERFSAAARETKFINDLTQKGIFGEFKTAVGDEGNKGKGDREIFDALLKDRENVLENKNPGVDIPGNTNIDAKLLDDSQIRAVMGLAPKS